MSFSYKLTLSILSVIKPKRFMAKRGDAFDTAIYKAAEKQKTDFPFELFKALEVSKKPLEYCEMYTIKRKNSRPKKAVIYFFGGGFFMAPQKADFKAIQTIIKNVDDVEVIMPMLPLLPHQSFSQICHSALESYKFALERFDPQSIQIMGFSSGASLIFYMFSYAQKLKETLPYPKNIVACSPAESVPPTNKQLDEMKKLKAKDYIMDPILIQELPRHMQDSPISLCTLAFDLKSFPSAYISFGTNEIFYAYLPAFQKVAKEQQLDFNFHIQKGMAHCWQLWYWTAEGQIGMKKVLDTIKYHFEQK